MKTIFNFLKQLKENNNREWFSENKKLYEDAKDEFETFVNALIPEIKVIDSTVDVNSAKECIFRIYRDVRFSKNKEPYKTKFGAYIVKGGKKSPYAGYYLHLQTGESFAGGGIYMPQPDILRTIRENIYNDSENFKRVISKPEFRKYFGEIIGDKLKTYPKGFPKNFNDIELLRFKSYTIMHSLKEEEFLDKNLMNKLLKIYSAQYEFNSYFNSVIR